MKLYSAIKIRWNGLLDTIIRFPLTIFLFVSAVFINAIAINTQGKELFTRLFITLLLGAFLSSVCQLIYERFFQSLIYKIALMGFSIVSSIIYYLLIKNTQWSEAVVIRTIVIFFLLLVAFLWVPSIKSGYDFNHSFMAAFKGFFIAIFFTGILFAGTALILGAINLLITPVKDKAYIHSANIIFILFAPTYFLSLIPRYLQKNMEKEYRNGLKPETGFPMDDTRIIEKSVSPSRLLESLVSYIIIPITAVFTIILLLYIIMNVSGDFWTNNLMEPLLLTYSLTVLIVYLLASSMKNTFARCFRMIFPKVLVPVVLFQTISSILKTGDIGITYGRYYIILFGGFATVSGILFSILPVSKNGIIAPILIALSLISIVPPVDSFTVSRLNQIGRLESVLQKNNMLEGDRITPGNELTNEDRETIITSVRYLDKMGYTKDITWLSSYQESGNFESTFGFAEYETDKSSYRNVSITRDENTPIPVSGYDYLIYRNISDQSTDFQLSSFEKNGKKHTIRYENTSKTGPVILLEQAGQKLLQFEVDTVFNKLDGRSSGTAETKEVTFTEENSSAVLTIIAQNVTISEWENGSRYADLYILVQVK